jgi:hypothetical protein
MQINDRDSIPGGVIANGSAVVIGAAIATCLHGFALYKTEAVRCQST